MGRRRLQDGLGLGARVCPKDPGDIPGVRGAQGLLEVADRWTIGAPCHGLATEGAGMGGQADQIFEDIVVPAEEDQRVHVGTYPWVGRGDESERSTDGEADDRDPARGDYAQSF